MPHLGSGLPGTGRQIVFDGFKPITDEATAQLAINRAVAGAAESLKCPDRQVQLLRSLVFIQ